MPCPLNIGSTLKDFEETNTLAYLSRTSVAEKIVLKHRTSNMFLAIINDTYSEVKAEVNARKEAFQVLCQFIQSLIGK
jgi:hypothetical protein